ncbi:MAG: YicC/YloC family endoribonuclease [Bacteroidota bacterium]
MLKSMTGYGSAKGTVGTQAVTVEIRSLNSKFLELNVRLPIQFRDKELEIRADVGKLLERGKADLNISIDNNELAKRSTVNKEIFLAYHDDLKSLVAETGMSDANMLDAILKLPAVLNSEKAEVDEEQWKQLKGLIQTAVEQFNLFRNNEGGVLEQDVTQRLNAIENAVPQLEVYEQARIESIRTRLHKSVNELKDQLNIDTNRFEQELIYYIEKLDISEEKVRLKSHCDYFLQTMNSKEANGKKLGFITQEIGREINTIGSKANDANMQRIVVEMKDELEKLKEQLANVL